MTSPLKLTALGLLSALLMATAMPMTANAGTLTIYNHNCTHLKWFKRKKSVTVHVYTHADKCTDTKVQVKTGQSKTIQLLEDGLVEQCHRYAHEAIGTVGGKFDINPREPSSVTCKRDGARVCQCTKD